jgi:hypothetical protein
MFWLAKLQGRRIISHYFLVPFQNYEGAAIIQKLRIMFYFYASLCQMNNDVDSAFLYLRIDKIGLIWNNDYVLVMFMRI